MAKLLYSWLNDEVRLGRPVGSLDEDFKSGYLFGELLYKHNQISDLSEFIDNDTADAKIKNFCLLEPVMRAVGVHFNSKIALEIIGGKSSMTKTLLYELKTSLDRIRKNSILANSNYSGNQPVRINRIVPPLRPAFDRTMAVTFENAVRAFIDAPGSDPAVEKTGSRHGLTAGVAGRTVSFHDSVSMSQSGYVSALQSERHRMREISRNKKQHEQMFSKAWDQISREQWNRNQQVAHDRRDMQRRFAATTQQQQSERTQKAQEALRSSTLRSIDGFDRRLETEIFADEDEDNSNNNDGDGKPGNSLNDALQKTVQGLPGSGLPDLVYLDQQTLQRGFLQATKTMKERTTEASDKQQSHDRLRRRFVRMRESERTRFLQSTCERDVLDQLVSPCRFEVVEDDCAQRIARQQHVLRSNAAFRAELVKSLDFQAQQHHELGWLQGEAVARELHWRGTQRTDAQRERGEKLTDAQRCANRQTSLAVVTMCVDRLLDVVHWTVAARALGKWKPAVINEINESGGDGTEVSLLPALLWRDICENFAADAQPESSLNGTSDATIDIAIAAALPLPNPINVFDALPESLSTRPECHQSSWLLREPLTGRTALPLKAYQEQEQEQIQPLRDVSEYLASVETAQFASLISEGNPESHSEYDTAIAGSVIAPSNDANPNNTGTVGNTVPVQYLSPTADWVIQTPSRFLLGEAVVAVRLAADPLQAQASTEPITAATPKCRYRYPLQMAISGLSDTARQRCREEFIRLCGDRLAIISVEALAQQTIAADIGGLSAVQKLVRASLLSGGALNDELLVSLAVEAVQLLPPPPINTSTTPTPQSPQSPSPCVGYVLLDLPNTRAQALLLFQALSGIDYASHKPQPNDKRSIFAAPSLATQVKQTHDVSQAGLDLVLLLSDTAAQRTAEVVASRLETVTAQVVQLPPAIANINVNNSNANFSNGHNDSSAAFTAMSNTSVSSVDTLQELYAPTRPYFTAGVDASVAEDGLSPLRELLGSMQLLREPGVALQSLAVPMTAVIDTSVNVDGTADVNTDVQINADIDAKMYTKNNEDANGDTGIDGRDAIDGFGSTSAIDADVENTPGQLETDASSLLRSAIEAIIAQYVPSVNANDDASNGNNEEEVEEVEEVDVNLGLGMDDLLLDPTHDTAALSQPVDAPNAADDVANAVNILASTPALAATVPARLGTVLQALWSHVEALSTSALHRYFCALRDVRYTCALQRRAAASDVIHRALVRSDDRRPMFEVFRDQFNALPADMRYDNDCIQELRLRALELVNAVWQGCDTRKAAADALLEGIRVDNVVPTQLHRSRCEAAVALQGELHRFHHALHVLFDASKAVLRCDTRVRVADCPSLEEALSVTPVPETVTALADSLANASAAANNAKGGKGKEKPKESAKKGGKGDKDAQMLAAVPFREPLAPLVLPVASMRALPDPPPSSLEAAAAEEGKGGAKGKPPAKAAAGKGAPEPPPANPLDAMEKAVQEVLEQWSKGSFTAQRAVYDNDEAVAAAVENAVWYEVDRLRFSMLKIRESLAVHCTWLTDCEASLIALLRDVIQQRYALEVATCERLLDMIHDAIDAFVPIREEWLLAPDVIAVVPTRLVAAYPPAPPEPSLQIFRNDAMNDEQTSVFAKWVGSLVVNNGMLLCQDVEQALDRCLSSVGPLNAITTSSNSGYATGSDGKGVLSHVTLPPQWREKLPTIAHGDDVGGDVGATSTSAAGVENIRLQLLPVVCIAGCDEHVGTIALAEVLGCVSGV